VPPKNISMCVCGSIAPGKTSVPVASITLPPATSCDSPMRATLPLSTNTSPTESSAAVTIRPPLMRRDMPDTSFRETVTCIQPLRRRRQTGGFARRPTSRATSTGRPQPNAVGTRRRGSSELQTRSPSRRRVGRLRSYAALSKRPLRASPPSQLLLDHLPGRREHVPEPPVQVQGLAGHLARLPVGDVPVQRPLGVGDDPAAGRIGVAAEQRRLGLAGGDDLLALCDLDRRPDGGAGGDTGHPPALVGDEHVQGSPLRVDED